MHDDDLDTEPYILEVSPFYQPNPKPYKNMVINYGDWKKTVSIQNSYQFELCLIYKKNCKQFSDSKMMES